jgi:myosin heavy subunit
VARLFNEAVPPAESGQGAGKGGRRGGIGAKSLSATFRADLGSLMDAINAADPHFVRALNPNAHVSSRSAFVNCLFCKDVAVHLDIYTP